MTAPSSPIDTISAGPQFEPPSKWKRTLVACLWIVPAGGFVVGILLLVTQNPTASQAGRKFISSLVYSALIGIPSSILLNWIGFRYTGRFPRLIVLMNIAVLLTTTTAGCLVGALILASGNAPHDAWREFSSAYPIALVVTLIFGLSVSSFETMRHKLQSATIELRTRQVEQERAYKLLAEARLSSLASRIHPHFLFNTLNSIASLIPSDPKRAEDTVSKLASLLRFSLNGNEAGLVPLAQELKIVRDFLEIEHTRFGARLRFQIDVPNSLDDVEVPPLALQSLVENAIKHVVAKRPEGATINVRGSLDGEFVRLEVVDDGPGFSLESISPEHGLGNLVARLELLFGERGQLAVARQDDQTVVTLRFPVKL
ncbi:MAG TPA: histidine kinase [Terracidiphilus sp.]|jgi:sensor histidine kinase YesM